MIKGLLEILMGSNKTRPEDTKKVKPYEFIFENGLDVDSQAAFARAYAINNNMDPVSFMDLVRKY